MIRIFIIPNHTVFSLQKPHFNSSILKLLLVWFKYKTALILEQIEVLFVHLFWGLQKRSFFAFFCAIFQIIIRIPSIAHIQSQQLGHNDMHSLILLSFKFHIIFVYLKLKICQSIHEFPYANILVKKVQPINWYSFLMCALYSLSLEDL